MKKILAIIPLLMVTGLAILNPVSPKEEAKQDAAPKQEVVLYSNDPGTGW
ncbi:hypothetical protein [Bacillus toyonensis]|nr:hypothetical protein [Bacillus toyonensis]